jgi:hypothetical protein
MGRRCWDCFFEAHYCAVHGGLHRAKRAMAEHACVQLHGMSNHWMCGNCWAAAFIKQGRRVQKPGTKSLAPVHGCCFCGAHAPAGAIPFGEPDRSERLVCDKRAA